MKIIRALLHPRAESERINAEIGSALNDLNETTAETHRTLQARYAPNAALREQLDKAKIMTTNFADFEKLIRGSKHRVH